MLRPVTFHLSITVASSISFRSWEMVVGVKPRSLLGFSSTIARRTSLSTKCLRLHSVFIWETLITIRTLSPHSNFVYQRRMEHSFTEPSPIAAFIFRAAVTTL
ncbi:hypothetical protein TNCV_239291 [Trichonephila clavipes]|nr:hypothetical protein TNCV_239291 [Trichonephila clavipes]